jgi:NADH-quinone oxidoreductase subunit M
MTIFTGAFQHPDLFHRVATIIAASSIVVTAVYILRVIGIFLLGEVNNKKFWSLSDAEWYEKVTIITMVVAIAGIGIAPLWLSDMISHSLTPIIHRILSINLL